jgi:uncharacterized protein (TIRG00374 family)
MDMVARNRIQILISSAFGVVVIVLMLIYVGIDNLLSIMSQASPIWLLASGLTFIPSYLMRAWRWGILLSSVKNPIKLSNTFWATSVGLMVNTIIPLRVGEFIRSFILSEREKISFASSFSTILAARIIDLLGLLTLGVLSILFLPIGTSIPSWILDALLLVCLLVVFLLLMIIIGTRREERLISYFDSFFAKIFFLSKRRAMIIGMIRDAIEGTRSISSNRGRLIKTFIITCLIWFFQTIGVWFVFEAFGFEAPIGIIFFGGIIVSLSYILPASPGYVGTYEAYWLLIFLGLGLTGTDQLLAMGIARHLINLSFFLILGSLGISWLGLSYGKIFANLKNYNSKKNL